MPGDWQKNLPLLTSERVQEVCHRDGGRWKAAVASGGHPRLSFAGKEDLIETVARLQNATDRETVRRRDDLRRVVEEILYVRWLRVNDHHPERILAQKSILGFPLPTYRTPDEMVGGTLIYQDALHQLWQRDVGDALPALALGAHIFPDIAAECRERMKTISLVALDFPTWGAWEPYVNMDLSSDHIARGIAVAYDWHREIWSDDEREKILSVLTQRVNTLLRGAYGAAFWARGWTDNHCQNAFATLGICGACFLNEIAEAEEWLGAAVAGFEYALPLCNPDGSSAEGVPYWSYGLSFILQYIELTKAISGADTLYESAYLRNSVSYRLHCSLPDLSGAVTFGDADSQDYYGPALILYALARQYRDGAAQWFGDSIPFRNRSGADIEAWTLLWRDSSLPPAAPATLPPDYHLPSWDVATTRNGWKPGDYVLAVKSGFTNRNHSHLDAGTLLYGCGGEWLIEAPGYGKVGPGFWDTSGPRWNYYANSTESHSTLLLDGVSQSFDVTARATITEFDSEPDFCRITVDLSGAYGSDGSVTRRILHRRGSYILTLDEIGSGNKVSVAEWLLQPGRNCSLVSDAASVTITGKAGGVRVQSISPDAGYFSPRRPTAPHIDIPESAIRTLALTSKGPDAAFAVLLLPLDATGVASEPTVRIEHWKPGNRRIIVEGPGFRDVLESA